MRKNRQQHAGRPGYPQWRQRPVTHQTGGPRLVDQAIARRNTGDLTDIHLSDPALSQMSNPWTLPDIGLAAMRINQAVEAGQRIAIETDYDVDGATSHVILMRALVDGLGVHPDNIKGFIGHRLTEGYGLSRPLAERIAAWQPDLVITADNGSSDEARIAWLAERGIHTIVTDHHAVEGSGPKSAYAVVNPSRADSKYPDPAIAGCAVAFLLSWATARRVGERADARLIRGLMDYVALGTVADCVSLGASINNRAFVRTGLALINSRTRACWRVALDHLGGTADAQMLAFQVGPRINARTRLADPMAVIHYLDAPTDDQARQWFAVLDDQNTQRKTIEHEMRVRATARIDARERPGCTVVHYDPEGHPGVHGIVASRLVERYGRPAICLSPHVGDSSVITGSARGVPGMSVYDAISAVQADYPGLIAACGGHIGAGGLTLVAGADPDAFADAYERAVSLRFPDLDVGPTLWHDGDAGLRRCTLAEIDQIRRHGPWGRGFESPCFVFSGQAEGVKAIGGDKRHIKFRLHDRNAGIAVDAIWFFALEEGQTAGERLVDGSDVYVLGEPTRNEFNGRVSVQVIVRDAHTRDR